MKMIISWITLSLFNISMLSGIILSFFYKPHIAYESVQKITYLIPYGIFFRKLHYFSSELLIMFLFFHIFLELKDINIKIKKQSWNFSIIAMILIFIMIFLGYVLKFDFNGESAGRVLITLIKENFILSKMLFLVQDNELFVWKFYILHIIFLPIVLFYAVYKHTKKIYTKYFLIGLSAVILGMFFFEMPTDIPPGLNVEATGPWFLKGAENLLFIGISSWIVFVVIIIPFFLLFFYYFEKYRKIIKILLFLWVVFYASFCFI